MEESQVGEIRHRRPVGRKLFGYSGPSLSLFRRPHENQRTVLTHTLIACLRPKCSSPDRKEKANSSSSFFEKENSIAVSSERKRMGGGRDRERASVPCVLFGGGAL
jgi:hypothetical protein